MSSVAVDARDHVWMIHRPRTVAPEQRANAAPAVLEFDASENSSAGWADRRPATSGPNGTRDLCRAGPNGLDQRQQRLRHTAASRQLRRHAPEVHVGGEVPAAVRAQRQERGRRGPRQRQATRGYASLRARERALRRRRLRQPSSRGVRRRHRQVQADVGRERRHALQHRAQHQGVERRAVYMADRGNKRVQVFTTAGEFKQQLAIGAGTAAMQTAAGLAFSPTASSASSTSPTSATTRSLSSIERR